jgi:hypothetical protein
MPGARPSILAKSIDISVILISFEIFLAGKLKSPSALGAPAGFSQSWFLPGLPWNAKVRRHARHVMMVVMTMVDAN